MFRNKLFPFLIFILFAFLITSISLAATRIVVTDQDKLLLKEKLDKFAADRNLPTGALILKIGLDFRDTPYVANTLDREIEENLVINLRELDCTTFVENCLAIALTIKSDKPDFATFSSLLQKIRYRNGNLNGYPSRLHYFSEWITDNAAKGFVKDVTQLAGGSKYAIALNFMGSHPDLYPQLKSKPVLIKEIIEAEKHISGTTYYFIPKEKLPNHENALHDGDIIALTTKIPGLDVSHLGLILKKDHKTYLLNASSIQMKVSITPLTLREYLNKSKNVSGIFVIRAN